VRYPHLPEIQEMKYLTGPEQRGEGGEISVIEELLTRLASGPRNQDCQVWVQDRGQRETSFG